MTTHFNSAVQAADLGASLEECIQIALRGATHDAARWAAIMTLDAAGIQPFSYRSELADQIATGCTEAAGLDAGKAAGLAVVAANRMLQNFAAQENGTADSLGLDPSDRLHSWSGRYDGAV